MLDSRCDGSNCVGKNDCQRGLFLCVYFHKFVYVGSWGGGYTCFGMYDIGWQFPKKT